MTHYTNRVCCGCAGNLDTGFRCWNIECRLAGITQTPPREAGAAQTPQMPNTTNVTSDTPESSTQASDLCEDEGCPHHGIPHVCVNLPQEQLKTLKFCEDGQRFDVNYVQRVREATAELRLIGMATNRHALRQVALEFNREPTKHELESLRIGIELFLKGYANAR